MTRPTSLAAVALLAGLVAWPAHAQDFARLAPPEAGFVVSVADYAATKERLLGTPLGRLTQRPEIAELIEEAQKAQLEAFEEMAAELGLGMEEWPEPQGMVGIAVVVRTVEPPEQWDPTSETVMVAAFDMGDGVVEIQRFLGALVEKGLDQGLIEIEAEDIGGVEVLTIKRVRTEEEPDIGEDYEAWVAWMEEQNTGLGGLFGNFNNSTVAIANSIVFLGDDRSLVIEALDRHQGAELPSLADDDTFAASLAQHPDSTTDYLVVMPGRMGFVDAMGAGMGLLLPPGFDFVEILDLLGITGLKSISLGLDLESTDAQAELTLGVLDWNRSGLVSLLDIEGQAWSPPSFASPDAVSATRILVDFDALPVVLREMWGGLPADIQDQGGMFFEQAMAYVEALTPILGPEVHLIQTIRRPFAQDSQQQLVAIPTSDELPLNNLLALGAGQGLETREFAGATVYDVPSDVGVSVSLAVAYGHFFVGTTNAVENGLRLAAAGAGESLAGDAEFNDAMRPLPSTGNVVQYTRAVEVADYLFWIIRNTERLQIESFREQGFLSDEDIQEMLAELDSREIPAWQRVITPELVADGVGDISMEIAPAADGFRGRILIHAPR